MSFWTVAWILWGVMFAVIETVAVVNDTRGDTLSEHLRRWFRTETRPGRTVVARRVWRVPCLVPAAHRLGGFRVAAHPPTHPCLEASLMLRPALVCLTAILAVLGVGVAPAVANHETYHPRVTDPWWPHGQDPNGTEVLRISLEGPSDVWGMRGVARDVQETVPNIRIYRHPSLDCDDRPYARCLVIKKVHRPGVDWIGRETRVNAHRRVIRLNTAKTEAWNGGGRDYVACHELVHALGIAHHQRKGCALSTHNNHFPRLFPSPVEYRTLTDFYSILLQ